MAVRQWFATQIINKLHELVTYTKKAGNKVFAIGKIILIKIIEFVKAHAHLVLCFTHKSANFDGERKTTASK